MVDKRWVVMMAQYSRWMNEKLYAHAATLSDVQRKEDRGAFFKSLHNTLDHIVWADTIWLGRFTGRQPELPIAGSILYPEFEAQRARRLELDTEIASWAIDVSAEFLIAPLTWTSRITGKSQTRAAGLAVTHFFNHQTHHRGQATTLLSQFGINPGVTDLWAMPNAENLL
ncbi:MAG TPA: DinB family protein [Rhodocyclaceae bacterium]|nr:DinB family protein [Rhodocyclaceae bacterium]